MKGAVFAVRERGSSATAADYEPRDLPTPTVRSVVAAVEEVEAFGSRCGAEAQRLGLTDPMQRSVLGDGADWIWGLAAQRFAGAAGVLDVYRAAEHLAIAGRAALGEGPALTAWLDVARQSVIGDGYCGACEALQQPLDDPAASERLSSAAAGAE